MSAAEVRPDRLATVAAALGEHAGAFAGFVRARAASADVDDILQMAALRAVERASTLDDPARVLAWLYRLHRNAIVDAARARGRRERLVEPVAEPLAAREPAIDATCGCSLRQAQALSPSYAAILQLTQLAGESIAGAAAELHVSVGNATVRLHRARRALRARMYEHCGVSSVAECLDCRCTYDGCCD